MSTSTQSISKISPSTHMAILLCTYNGARFLAPQLDSIKAQTFRDISVWISDDASHDATLAVLSAYQQNWEKGRMYIQTGAGHGAADNFLSLVCRRDIQAKYYAYCDQDDIWHPEKLERAADWLERLPQGVPALYCSRTELIDDNGERLGFSPLHTRPLGFANALVQNVGGGNTMVFNDAARRLLLDAGQVKVGMHDWWTYMVVSGCGGQVRYDPIPYVCYRQHGMNVLGSNTSWAARFDRIGMLLGGKFRQWNDLNVQALSRIHGRLTDENKMILDTFIRARTQPLFPRLNGLNRCGIYRQTTLGNLGLIAGAVFNRI